MSSAGASAQIRFIDASGLHSRWDSAALDEIYDLYINKVKTKNQLIGEYGITPHYLRELIEERGTRKEKAPSLPPPSFSREQDDIYEAYIEARKTKNAIVKEFGISLGELNSLIYKRGTRKERGLQRYDPEDLDQIYNEYINTNKTKASIIKEFGVNIGVLNTLIDKRGSRKDVKALAQDQKVSDIVDPYQKHIARVERDNCPFPPPTRQEFEKRELAMAARTPEHRKERAEWILSQLATDERAMTLLSRQVVDTFQEEMDRKEVEGNRNNRPKIFELNKKQFDEEGNELGVAPKIIQAYFAQLEEQQMRDDKELKYSGPLKHTNADEQNEIKYEA
jgi:transposase-like protein